VSGRVRALQTFAVETACEEVEDGRGGGLAGEEGERHPRSRVRVNDAGRVADEKDIAGDGPVEAEVNRLGEQNRAGYGREALEVGGE